jgi:hypothetical protein
MRRTAPWVKAINTLLAPTVRNRQNKVDAVVDKALAAGEAASGGTAEGDERFTEDYRFYAECLAAADGLTPIGWYGLGSELASRFENRFRIRRLHAERPEIGREPIERPIVVVGMPRTGTTLTHNILAGPEAHRAPLLWELLSTDLADVEPALRKRYMKTAERTAGGMATMSPAFELIHAMHATGPEECIFVLPHGLPFFVRADMPEYGAWYLDRDHTADYVYLKQALQVLQHGREPRRWVLKSPAHLWNLDALLAVFPDAQVVWNHRAPQKAVASMCSLVECVQGTHLRRVDLDGIGREWLEKLAEAVRRARAARSALPEQAVIDLSYANLTDDPRSRVPELFERLGAEWTAAEKSHLERLLDRPRHVAAGGHRYDLARYGLTDERVDEAFGDYSALVAAMS